MIPVTTWVSALRQACDAQTGDAERGQVRCRGPGVRCRPGTAGDRSGAAPGRARGQAPPLPARRGPCAGGQWAGLFPRTAPGVCRARDGRSQRHGWRSRGQGTERRAARRNPRARVLVRWGGVWRRGAGLGEPRNPGGQGHAVVELVNGAVSYPPVRGGRASLLVGSRLHPGAWETGMEPDRPELRQGGWRHQTQSTLSLPLPQSPAKRVSSSINEQAEDCGGWSQS